MEIIFEDVGYRYKNKKILDHINLKIKDNHIIGITGKYKTLLCEMISAQIFNYTGIIRIGKLIINKENLKKIRREVAFIQQDSQKQFLTEKVKEEILFLVSCIDYQPKNLDKRIEQSFMMVGLDSSFLDRKIKSLSSGEKKQLQIAISLIHNPNIIILDEPFIELDYLNRRRLSKLLKVLRERYHKTIIISSNDSNLLYEMTEDMVILKKGRILVSGKTIEVYQDINLLAENDIEMPNLVQFTVLSKQKNVKLAFHKDIRDLIKDVYKHV